MTKVKRVRDCKLVVQAPTVGDHRGSGGCSRAWVSLDGLRHQCRASRDATLCRCPCGATFPEEVEPALTEVEVQNLPTWDRPCAAPGLRSYRYRSRHGYVMVGAAHARDARAEVLRSIDPDTYNPMGLERWDPQLKVYRHVEIL